MVVAYEDLLKLITEKTDLSEKEVSEKIKEKIDALSGLISKDGAALIVANELGVKVENNNFSSKLSISNLVPGMRNVNVVARVIKAYDLKEFKRKDDSEGKVKSLFIGDNSGAIRAVLWNSAAEIDVKENDSIKISNGYVKDNNGRAELNVNNKDDIELNPEGVSFSSEIKKKKISELNESDLNVELLGTILQVYDIRFYEVCPVCNKKVLNGVCNEHGDIDPKFNYVLNLILDDSSGNIRVVLFNNLVDKLLGMNRDQVLEFKDLPFEKIKTQLLGNIVKIIGRVVKNKMFDRLECIAKDVVLDVDFKRELELLKEDLERDRKELKELDKEISEETGEENIDIKEEDI